MDSSDKPWRATPDRRTILLHLQLFDFMKRLAVAQLSTMLMLTPKTRLRLQEIIQRIAKCEPVSLRDRIYVQKFADRDPTVWSWLRRARRSQQEGIPKAGLDHFLAQMDLGEVGPSGAFDPSRDDLGDWFTGAPNWLRRS
jgi:hypothetical protein